MDEEYDDVEFNDEDNVALNDPFAENEIDLENLITRFANAEDNDESIDGELENEENLLVNDSENLENRNNDVESSNRLNSNLVTNQEQNRTEVHSFSDDYLIGQSRLISSSTLTENYENLNVNSNVNSNVIINRNLIESTDSSEQNGNQAANQDMNINSEILNQMPNNPSIIDNEASASSSQDERSRLGLSNESLNSLVDTDILVSRTTNLSEEEFAKTGEPLQLCRLRRRAVRILSERIKIEKQYYEDRENELKQRLDSLQVENCELEDKLKHLRKPDSKIVLMSTAFVFSLIGYFLQNLSLN